MSAISEKKNVDMLCEAMQTVTPHSEAEELEARKQDFVFDGADETELVPDEEEEDWREAEDEEDDEFQFERRAREGYVP